MDEKKNYKYYVVVFMDPPYTGFDKYVCIPDSWIQLREISDQIVAVKYPIEEISETKKRVKKSEKHSDKWSIFVAHVKYGTDSYQDAKNFINEHENMIIQPKSHTDITNQDNQPSTFKKKASKSGSNLSTSEIKKPETSGARINPDTKSTVQNDTVLKQPSLADFNLETHKKSTDVNDPGLEEKLSNHEVCCEQQRKENKSSIIDDICDSMDNCEEDQEPIFKDVILDSLRKMHSCLEVKIKLSEQIYLRNKNDSEMIQSLIKAVENCKNIFNYSILNEMIDRVKKVDEEIEIENVADIVQDNKDKRETVHDDKDDDHDDYEDEDENDDYENEKDDDYEDDDEDENDDDEDEKDDDEDESDDDEDEKNDDHDDYEDDDDGVDVNNKDENKNHPLKERGQARKFTLPPDYRENDSKWTLRHREKSDELSELMPHSGVYVRNIELKYCKKICKDRKTLARMLLTAVFTESALSTCSFTGKKSKALSINVRPGLDAHARTVLLNYVEQHAQENNWPKLDRQSILKSIRYKLGEMRRRSILMNT